MAGTLIFLCDECKAPNQVGSALELSLDYIHALVCRECCHRHEDLAELRNYAKQTRKIGTE